jgi:hypothetical protein
MKYAQLATDLMFSAVRVADLATKYGLQFRKNKTGNDISNAIRKARRAGYGKVEFEMNMLEFYLKEILKKA